MTAEAAPGSPAMWSVRAFGVAILAAAVACAPDVAGAGPVPPSPSLLRARLGVAQKKLGVARTHLSGVTGADETSLADLHAVDARLRTTTQDLSATRHALSQDQTALGHTERLLNRDRRRVTNLKGDADAVVRYQQVLGAQPLDAVVLLLEARSVNDLLSRATQLAQIGAYTGSVVHRALILEREVRAAERTLAARTRRMAGQRRALAAQEATLGRQRLKEASLAAQLTDEKDAAARLVGLLDSKTANLRLALESLLAAIRSGEVGPGQVFSLVAQIADRFGLDPLLVWAVINVESGGDAGAVSTAGAQGLMQLMPGTARGLGVRNPLDAKENVEGGVRYLAGLIRHYHGNLALALAAYNMGPAAVDRYGGALPPDPAVRAYVSDVLGKLDALAKRHH